MPGYPPYGCRPGVAEALGISRRMVSYYRTAHKPIPRAIWLACLGWEAMRPKDRALPTAREYAALHPIQPAS